MTKRKILLILFISVPCILIFLFFPYISIILKPDMDALVITNEETTIPFKRGNDCNKACNTSDELFGAHLRLPKKEVLKGSTITLDFKDQPSSIYLRAFTSNSPNSQGKVVSVPLKKSFDAPNEEGVYDYRMKVKWNNGWRSDYAFVLEVE
jgi:hypothetical protein